MKAFKNFGRSIPNSSNDDIVARPAADVAWSGWLYKAGTKRKIWRRKFFKVVTKGKGSFEHYGDDKSDKERGVMLFKEAQGVAWLGNSTTPHSQNPDSIHLKFLILTSDTSWLVRCENDDQKAELQNLFAKMLPTLVAVERQNFRRVEKKVITRRKVTKSRFFVLLSNWYLVEFYDDTVAQIKEVENLQFLQSCHIEQEEWYKRLRLVFKGIPPQSNQGGHTHSRTVPHAANGTDPREVLLLFDDTKGVPETMNKIFSRWNSLFADAITTQRHRHKLSGSALDLFEFSQAIKFEDFRITDHIKNTVRLGVPDALRNKAWLGFLYGASPFGFGGASSKSVFEDLCRYHEGKSCIQMTYVLNDVTTLREYFDPNFLRQLYLVFTIWFHEQSLSGVEMERESAGRTATGPACPAVTRVHGGIQVYNNGLLLMAIRMLRILQTPHDTYHVLTALSHFVFPACYEDPISEFRIYGLAFHEMAGGKFAELTFVLKNARITWSSLISSLLTSLFAGYVKASILVRIWDMLFICEPVSRSAVLIRTALCLVKMCESQLLQYCTSGEKLTSNSVTLHWRKCLHGDNIDAAAFLDSYFAIKFDRSLPDCLKRQWRKVQANAVTQRGKFDSALKIVKATQQLCTREVALISSIVDKLHGLDRAPQEQGLAPPQGEQPIAVNKAPSLPFADKSVVELPDPPTRSTANRLPQKPTKPVVSARLSSSVMDVHIRIRNLSSDILNVINVLARRISYFAGVHDVASCKASSNGWNEPRNVKHHASGISQVRRDNPKLRRVVMTGFAHCVDSCLWTIVTTLKLCYKEYTRLHFLQGTWAWYSHGVEADHTDAQPAARPRRNTKLGALKLPTNSTSESGGTSSPFTSGTTSSNGIVGTPPSAPTKRYRRQGLSPAAAAVLSTGKVMYSALLRFLQIFSDYLRVVDHETSLPWIESLATFQSSLSNLQSFSESFATSTPFATTKAKHQQQAQSLQAAQLKKEQRRQQPFSQRHDQQHSPQEHEHTTPQKQSKQQRLSQQQYEAEEQTPHGSDRKRAPSQH